MRRSYVTWASVRTQTAMGRHLRAKIIAAILLLHSAAGAPAQEIEAPEITFRAPEWDTVIAALDGVEALRKLPSAPATANPPLPDLDLLARLNAATGKDFPDIAASPVPVLLPLNLEAYQRGKTDGRAGNQPDTESFSGFRASKFFLAGPSGYDAAFHASLPAPPARRSKAPRERDVEIQITGMALLYQLGERVGGEEKPSTGLQADFPGIRRFYFEGHMRYLFERHGVLYSTSIECFDGRSHRKRLSCQDAHPLAVRFLKALTVAGGMPQPAPPKSAPIAGRPDSRSTAFSYYPPGQLIPGTGARRRGGDADYTVYAKIRFPLAEAPAHTYSQMFMNMGDCTRAAGDSRTVKRRGSPFSCARPEKVAGTVIPSGGQNDYPWRDNFCEARGFFVGQCPSGIGHQGQDIVPVDCRLSSQDSSRCDRSHHRIVAVHDGVILRAPGQEGLMIAANAPGSHLRFRYLHMNPKLIDEDGFLSGRVVREGETVGKVGNYSGREGGTSYHLHFDMQVPTKDGWVLVNPYMTLVTAYEHLIGGRGEQIREIEDASRLDADVGQTSSIAPAPKRPSTSKHKSSRKHRVIERTKYYRM